MGKMPPWFADPRYGHFANDRRLSAEIHQIVSWVDAGAPKATPKIDRRRSYGKMAGIYVPMKSFRCRTHS